MSGTRVTINAPHVIHETIDGEVIVINLATGTYYSLKESAAELWQLIARGARETDLVEALAARYEKPAQPLKAELEPFLAELEREGLVSLAEAVEGFERATEPAADPVSPNGHLQRQDFAPPVLEKFTDMQDLVLLDPVHEVDETGWPQRADAASGVAGA